MSTFFGYLYAMPSFNEGLARTLDIGATFDDYNYSKNGREAETLAIWSDWYTVGEDITRCLDRLP